MDSSRPALGMKSYAAFALAGVFLFFYGALLLVSAAAWTPLAARLGYLLKPRDALVLLAALAVFIPAFILWARYHVAYQDLQGFRFPAFVAHSLVLYAGLVGMSWAWSLAPVAPLAKLVMLGAVCPLLMPSLSQVTGYVLRVAFFSLLRTAVPRPAGGDPIEQFRIPSYTPPARFYAQGLRCLNQARRFDLHLGALLIAFDKGQVERRAPQPHVERPLLHQVLFLLTELNRQYEPWTYFHERGVFVNVLLLSGPHHVGPVCDRFSRILRDRVRDHAGAPLSFRLLAARKKPAPVSLATPVDRGELERWLQGLFAELAAQREAVHIKDGEG